MSEIIVKASEYLKELLINEDLKIPDQNGITPLLLKAKKNSQYSPLSAEAKFEELVVCYLVRFFDQFDQIQFSELESYILVSNFPTEGIVDAFNDYILSKKEGEDVVFKACIARMIQGLNSKTFSSDFLSTRFQELENLDPWLFAELIINSNWIKGVEIIEHLLQNEYDASYLFTMLPTFIKKHSSETIGNAMSQWYPMLLEEDRELAQYYSNNYGFVINKPQESDQHQGDNKLTKRFSKGQTGRHRARMVQGTHRLFYADRYVTEVQKKEVIAKIVDEYKNFITHVDKQPIFYLTLCSTTSADTVKRLRIENE
jgi:hypothetical protein